MVKSLYEHHIMPDKLLPFIFRTDTPTINSLSNWHNNMEILLVVRGEGYVKCDTNEYFVKPGDIVVINSDTMHLTKMDDETEFVYHCLIIDRTFCRENGIDANEYVFCEKISDVKMCELYFDVAKRWEEVSRDKNAANIAKMRCAVIGVLVELWENYLYEKKSEDSHKNSSAEYVKKASLYIHENYSSRIDLEDLAHYAGISKFHLSREFKKYTGQTIFTYINKVRCKEAEACIFNEMNVAEAARECGFENMSYFSKTYKKFMGKLPSESKK